MFRRSYRRSQGRCGLLRFPLYSRKPTSAVQRVMSVECRFCCKSRKSNDPENLAKGDFQRAVTSRSVVTPLRRSVVVFPRNDLVPHIVTCNTRQRPRKCSFVTPKRLLQQNLPEADIPVPYSITSSVRASKEGITVRPGAFLFDHVGRSGEQRGWNSHIECLGCLQVDRELECSRLLDRQIAGCGSI